jgi:8-oxo-dGTP diphosphatase
MEDYIRAAGGIIYKKSTFVNFDSLDLSINECEIIIIHRPKYEDWSLPKGKAEYGESYLDCAIREVEEETGLYCSVESELTDVTYIDRGGNDKLVKYYVMTEVGSETENPHPSIVAFGEVDVVSWTKISNTYDILTYDRDREVVDKFKKYLEMKSK